MLATTMKAGLAVVMVALMPGLASPLLVVADSHGAYGFGAAAMTKLEPGAEDWHTLTCSGSGTVEVGMDVDPDGGAAFLIVTPDAVHAWEAGEELAVTGRGADNPVEETELFWSGSCRPGEEFYLVVEYTGDGVAPSSYSLHVSGAEVAGEAAADGIWCYLPDMANLKVLDIGAYPPGKMFLSATYTGEWTGTFHGGDSPEDAAHSEDTGLLVAHEIPAPPGFAPMLFVGTVSMADVAVGGASGSLEMDVAGDILAASPAEVTEWSGSWIITSGTGGLSNLRGHGTWWGPGWLGDPNECGVIYYSVDHLEGEE